ncbi:MAG TPA: alpha/beta fold hydrolase [Steroidobacteraceae bacterium]|jgi:dipeptidyl aminopeptidase/acylaminoacyl peptidase
MTRMYPYSGALCALALLAGAPYLHAEGAAPFDAASAFGARPDVTALRLSPDGRSVSFVSPYKGQGSVASTVSLAPGSKPKVAFFADGKPFRVRECNWVSNERLICTVFGLVPDPRAVHGFLPITRMVAVNADGTKSQQLSTPMNAYSRGYLLRDGAVIDWVPGQDGSVLVARNYLPDSRRESHVAKDLKGLGVDSLDTNTLAVKHIVTPREDAYDYISDGYGTVRIVAERNRLGQGADRSDYTFLYRLQGSDTWHHLSTYNYIDRTGFLPVAVDHDLNIAYGWKKLDGRIALYSMSLDDSPQEKLVFSRPDVDLGGLIRIGRHDRVVGVVYNTDVENEEYFQDDVRQTLTALHKALPQKPLLRVVDASLDESKLLIFARSDIDPGVFYILDRSTHALHTFLVARDGLEDTKLAHVKTVEYPAADGQKIPGYLTLPPGVDNPRGLPAIVLPHGNPNRRDEWGFDWLAQFFAARGYVVLQPNYRGSHGYGDDWFEQNGFKSWNIAVGDIVAAGRWLVTEGIADPSKLGIVGWSYGGYAALQSAAVDASVFKAIVAIAPITDLAAFKDERRYWSSYDNLSDIVGDGPSVREGSPITHVSQIKQPVLMFHGTSDREVAVVESRRMADALKAAGVQSELVTYQDLDDQLEDSAARTDMLRRSDAFLRHSFAMSP